MNKIVFLPLIENIYEEVKSLYDDAEYQLVLIFFPKTIFIILNFFHYLKILFQKYLKEV